MPSNSGTILIYVTGRFWARKERIYGNGTRDQERQQTEQQHENEKDLKRIGQCHMSECPFGALQSDYLIR